MIRIEWSNQAQSDYWNNISYLLEDWSIKEASTFVETVNEALLIIKAVPKAFPFYDKIDYPDIQYMVITKQITLFYRKIDNEVIELLRFWNNYQDSDSLSF